MIDNFPVFGQRNYPQELGTGNVSPIPTIADYGCVLCSVTACLNYFGKHIDPLALNKAIIEADGFVNNGNGDYDLLSWPIVTTIYPEVPLIFNKNYGTIAADLALIDGQLEKDLPVIVGVSFLHNPMANQPTHYVVIFKKNADGTYQCSDPWYNDIANFNTRYAVNDLTAAQCILQAICYNGPLPQTTGNPQPSIPTPTIPVFTNQTKIPIGKDNQDYDWGEMEIQAIRGALGDQRKKLADNSQIIIELQKKISDYESASNTPTPGSSQETETPISVDKPVIITKSKLQIFFENFLNALQPWLPKKDV